MLLAHPVSSTLYKPSGIVPSDSIYKIVPIGQQLDATLYPETNVLPEAPYAVSEPQQYVALKRLLGGRYCVVSTSVVVIAASEKVVFATVLDSDTVVVVGVVVEAVDANVVSVTLVKDVVFNVASVVLVFVVVIEIALTSFASSLLQAFKPIYVIAAIINAERITAITPVLPSKKFLFFKSHYLFLIRLYSIVNRCKFSHDKHIPFRSA